MQDGRFRLGRYWLDTVRGSANYYRFWYDARAGEVRRRSLKRAGLDATDFEACKAELASIVVNEGQGVPRDSSGVTLLSALARYWEEHSDHRPNKSTARRAGRLWLDFLGDNAAKVSDLTKAKQREFIKWMGAKGYAVAYISRVQAIVGAALNRATAEDEEDTGALLTRAPKMIAALPAIAEILDAPEPEPDNWHPTLAEIARFLDAVPPEEETRILRYAVLVLAFAGRPEAVKELTSFQIDTRHKLVDFNGKGRRQTKKYRPTVPIPPRLLKPLLAWARECEHIVHRDRKPVFVLRKPWTAIRTAAKLPSTFRPKALRHFMATELRRRRVLREQREAYMGHRRLSTNDQYGVFAPDYLKEARDAANAVLRELEQRCKKPLYRQNAAKSPRKKVSATGLKLVK